MDYLLVGSTVIELGWVKFLKRVLSFFPFKSTLLIFPFSPLVQYTLFQIQSTARPEMCLSEENSFWKTKFQIKSFVNQIPDQYRKIKLCFG